MPLGVGVGLASAGAVPALPMALVLVWLGLGGLLYGWARNPAPLELPARARADASGLHLLGRHLEAPRIRGGWLEPRPHGPPVVHVQVRSGRDVHLVVRDLDRGRALLAALDVGAAHASATYWALARPLGEPRSFARIAAIVGLVLAFGAVAGQSTPAAMALAVVALFAVFLAAVVPTAVVVGADGVLLRWLGTSRFIPWASVMMIEAFDGGVVLALDGGRWLTLRMPADHERHHPERDAMVERMRQAWRSHEQSPPDEAAARLVRRSGGHTREWVRAVRSVAQRERGYRAAAVPPERLWRVVESSGADRHARTGAALALAPSLDESGRERLRAVANACAEPRLRIALTTVASDAGAAAPDDELAATLDAIESDGDEENAARG